MLIMGVEVTVKQGDITQEDSDAIVNAANNEFYMGGGVAGAIKKKGGQAIEDEAVALGPVEVGESVITKAGKLKAKHVIHASTMAMDFKTDDDKIRKATASSLRLSQENKLSSISFCALGCGVGKFSYKDSAKIMTQEVFKYLRETPQPCLKRIAFVLFSPESFEVFNKNVYGYLDHLARKVTQGPFLTVDGIIEYQGGIVLIERHNPPFGWAIPGGFVDYGESVEESVKREVQEETSLDFVDFKLFGVYSQPKRDPRFHTTSVVFAGKGQGRLSASSDAKDAKVFSLDGLPEKIAFDHRKIISDYIKSRKA